MERPSFQIEVQKCPDGAFPCLDMNLTELPWLGKTAHFARFTLEHSRILLVENAECIEQFFQCKQRVRGSFRRWLPGNSGWRVQSATMHITQVSHAVSHASGLPIVEGILLQLLNARLSLFEACLPDKSRGNEPSQRENPLKANRRENARMEGAVCRPANQEES